MKTRSGADMHPSIKLTFADDTRFFGPGTVMLLREIDRCGNVRKACENCGFSYSKGWTIIRKCESRFGSAIVERQAGGQNGGAASVSEHGKRLLTVYDELESELKRSADEKFAELMDKYGLSGEEE